MIANLPSPIRPRLLGPLLRPTARKPGLLIPRRRSIWRPRPTLWNTAGKTQRNPSNGKGKRKTDGKIPRDTSSTSCCCTSVQCRCPNCSNANCADGYNYTVTFAGITLLALPICPAGQPCEGPYPGATSEFCPTGGGINGTWTLGGEAIYNDGVEQVCLFGHSDCTSYKFCGAPDYESVLGPYFRPTLCINLFLTGGGVRLTASLTGLQILSGSFGDHTYNVYYLFDSGSFQAFPDCNLSGMVFTNATGGPSSPFYAGTGGTATVSYVVGSAVGGFCGDPDECYCAPCGYFPRFCPPCFVNA